MAERNPKEAADRFVFFLRETLSCVSDHFVSAFQQSEKLFKVYYDPYATIRSREGHPYCLSITQIFRVVPHPQLDGQFKAKTQEYSYRLLNTPKEQAEIVAYHWHPQEPGVQYPHLHITACPRVHFPTSRVCLEDFISMLMRDYKIRPRKSYAQCKEILERNKKAFEKSATWKVQHD